MNGKSKAKENRIKKKMADKMKTRSGRIVKSPRNEYTDREYVAGSGFVGADHYDRNYDGRASIDEIMKYKGSGEYDTKDGFVVDEVEEAECEEECEEESEEEFEEESDEEEEYEGESDEEEEYSEEESEEE